MKITIDPQKQRTLTIEFENSDVPLELKEMDSINLFSKSTSTGDPVTEMKNLFDCIAEGINDIRAGNQPYVSKIEMIKSVRKLTACSLMDGKKIVEKLFG